MRKVSLAVIASFAALAITTSVTGGAFDVGTPQDQGQITIVKQVEGDGTPPAQWEFTVTSENCGASIFVDSGAVESTTVTIGASGGSQSVTVQDFPLQAAVVDRCTYSVAETPVEGWVVNPEAYVAVGAGETVTFVNTADTTTSSSSTTSTTSTTEAPTPSDETATTAVVTTSASAPAPRLPDTGPDSNTQLALIAGSVLLAGIAATLASRRRPVS